MPRGLRRHGHAKNFSLFPERGGHHRLTPFCDVLSAWPILGHGAGKISRQKLKMAMAVEGKTGTTCSA